MPPAPGSLQVKLQVSQYSSAAQAVMQSLEQYPLAEPGSWVQEPARTTTAT